MIHQLQLIEAYNCDRFSNVESCFEKERFSALMLKSFLLSLILKYFNVNKSICTWKTHCILQLHAIIPRTISQKFWLKYLVIYPYLIFLTSWNKMTILYVNSNTKHDSFYPFKVTKRSSGFDTSILNFASAISFKGV